MKISNKYYKTVFLALVTLALPTMLEQILSVLMQYVDTAMVGHLGQQATASVSVSTTITWLIGSVPGAFGVATMSKIAQAVGRGNYDEIKKIAKHSLLFALAVGLLIEIVCLAVSPMVPVWMGAEAEIVAPATRYFAFISAAIIFRSLNIILNSAIRATKDTKTPMYIGVGANLINVLLDYVFIYMMGMGVDGAAIASFIGTVLAGIASLIAFFKNDMLRYPVSDFTIDKGVLSDMWKMSFPVLIINVASCSGYVVFAGLVSHMGTTIFAAHSIAVGAEELFYIGGYGFKSAATTLTGISYGEQNHEKYKAVTRISTIMTVSVMSLSGLLLYVFALPLMNVFTTDMQVAQLGATVLKMVAFSEPFFGIYIITEGFYYGLGRTKYPLVIEMFSMWAVRILSTYICIYHLHGDLTAVWLCMIADNVTKAILLAVRVPRLWKRESFDLLK